jgi:hypothetical protein
MTKVELLQALKDVPDDTIIVYETEGGLVTLDTDVQIRAAHRLIYPPHQAHLNVRYCYTEHRGEIFDAEDEQVLVAVIQV